MMNQSYESERGNGLMMIVSSPSINRNEYKNGIVAAPSVSAASTTTTTTPVKGIHSSSRLLTTIPSSETDKHDTNNIEQEPPSSLRSSSPMTIPKSLSSSRCVTPTTQWMTSAYNNNDEQPQDEEDEQLEQSPMISMIRRPLSLSKRSSSVPLSPVPNRPRSLSLSNRFAAATITPSLSSSVPSQPYVQRQRKNSWWQQSIVRRTVSFIENELEKVIQSSSFLKENYTRSIPKVGIDQDNNTMIGLFHRSEIVIGECLGYGGFSVVYEIIDFQLDDDISDRCTELQQQIRHHYVQTCYDPVSTTYRYAIKFLKENLINNSNHMTNSVASTPSSSPNPYGGGGGNSHVCPPSPCPPSPYTGISSHHNNKKYNKKDYQNAAVDLVIEVAYMSCLHDHPNIMSIRGLPVDGIYAFNVGQCDGYFIIMDRLICTLDHRIHKEWKYPKHSSIHELFDQYHIHRDDNKQVLGTEVAATTDSTTATTREIEDRLLYQKISYASQLSSAIQFLHSKNIMFRDIKPHNIGFVSNRQSDISVHIMDDHHLDDTTTPGGQEEMGFPYDDHNTKDEVLPPYERLVLFDFGLCRELPLSSLSSSDHSTEMLNPTTDSSVEEFIISSQGDHSGDDDEGRKDTINEVTGQDDDDDDNETLFVMSGVGTRRYMAPEIVHHNHRYNAKADVYSFSMVLWEMLTLSKPYPNYNADEHRVHVCQNGERPPLVLPPTTNAYHHQGGLAPLAPFLFSTSSTSSSGFLSSSPAECWNIPPVIQQLLQRTWEHQISKRYNMKQVCDALQSFLQDYEVKMNAQQTNQTNDPSSGMIPQYSRHRPILESSSSFLSHNVNIKRAKVNMNHGGSEPASPNTVLDLMLNHDATTTTSAPPSSHHGDNNVPLMMLPHIPIPEKGNSGNNTNDEEEEEESAAATTSLQYHSDHQLGTEETIKNDDTGGGFHNLGYLGQFLSSLTSYLQSNQ